MTGTGAWLTLGAYVAFMAIVIRVFLSLLRGESDVDELSVVDTEERVLQKGTALRERHDLLLAALRKLVVLHRGPANAVGNWDVALAEAEQAIETAERPLLEQKTADSP